MESSRTIVATLALTVTCYTLREYLKAAFAKTQPDPVTPVSVNYHFTRHCNYECGFCFHTSLNKTYLPIEEAKRGMLMLRDAGTRKINFAGGEPFIIKGGRYLGELARYCKKELQMVVSIVSNGSLIKESWLREYHDCVDVLAVSCDSFNEEVNKRIGRSRQSAPNYRGASHIEQMRNIQKWCSTYNVEFKINSVVNTYNWDEDMTAEIAKLQPMRWKVFRCLVVEGENAGPSALRRAADFLVTDEQFHAFVKRHKSVGVMVTEDNDEMQDSYVLLDEKLRFLDCSAGAKEPTASILDVGVEEAFKHAGYNHGKFIDRDGMYFADLEQPAGAGGACGTGTSALRDIEDILQR